MANPTQEFLDALKEADKVAFINTLISAHGGGLTPDEKKKLGYILVTKTANLDIMSDNIQVAFNRIAALGLDASGQNLMSTKDIELLTKQVISADPVVAGKDNRLMSVASVLKALTDMSGAFIKKGVSNLVIGDRSGEAQLTLDAKTGDASHVVFKRDGVAKSSMGVIASNNDELIIEQRANDDVRFIIPAGNTIVAKIGTEFKTVAFTDSLPVAKTITDVAEIDATGVYDGTDIAQAPITGDVIIEAYKDAKGDFDLSCKGADMRRYEGGKQKGTSGAIHWGTVAPDHLFGTTVPADTLGQDGDIYFKVK